MSKINFHKMLENEIRSHMTPEAFELKKKWRDMRAKMQVWARFNRILKVLRDNKPEIVAIKSRMPDGKLPHWSLIGGKTSVHANFMNYYVKKHYD